MLFWPPKIAGSSVLTPPRIASAENDADVVLENESGESDYTRPSPPDNKVLFVDKFLKEFESNSYSEYEYFEIDWKSTSLEIAEIGDSKPKVAGAMSKLLKSFIIFLTQKSTPYFNQYNKNRNNSIKKQG